LNFILLEKNYNIFTNNIVSEFSWAIERAGDGVWKWVIEFERKPMRQPLQWPQMLGIMSKQKKCESMYVHGHNVTIKKKHLSSNSQVS
jgi:hypothetical protein